MNTDNLIYAVFIVCALLNWLRWILFARTYARATFKYVASGFVITFVLTIIGIIAGSIVFDFAKTVLPLTPDIYRYLADLIASSCHCAIVSVPTHYVLKALANKNRSRDTVEIDSIGISTDQ